MRMTDPERIEVEAVCVSALVMLVLIVGLVSLLYLFAG